MIASLIRLPTTSLRRIREVTGSGDIDALLLAFCMVASRLLGALTGLVLARRFGVVSFGEYATAVAFGGICATMADLNLASPVIRAYAQGRRDAGFVYGNALIIKTLAAVIAVFISVFVSAVVAGPRQAALMTLAVASALVGGFASLPVAALQASSRIREMSMWILGGACTTAVTAIVVVATGGGPRHVLGWVLVANALLSVLALVRSAAVMPISASLVRLLLDVRECLPFAVGGIAYVIYYQVDQVMLGIMVPGTEPGVYAAAYRIAAFLYIVPGAFATTFYPRLFRAHDIAEEHRKTVVALLERSAAFGLLGSAVVFAVAEPLVRILYGAAFEESGGLLRVLVWFPALQSMSFPLGDALTTTGRQGARMAVMVSAAFINVIGNLIAIPRAGALGAAVVTLVTECIILVGYAVLALVSGNGKGTWRRYLADADRAQSEMRTV